MNYDGLISTKWYSPRVCRYRTKLVYDIYEINDKIDRSGTSVGESIFGVALVPSLGTLGINVFHSRFLLLYLIFI